MMISNNSNSLSLLTVQQFAEAVFPSLMQQLVDELQLAIRDAISISEKAIQELKARFTANKLRPVEVFQSAITTIVSAETNKLKRSMDKNFGLSEMAFAEMVEQLQQGNERLYEQVFLHHFESCVVFVKNKYQASQQDAYDASMDAMLAFCRKLKEGRIQYGNLRFLFTQMASHIYLKWIKREGKKEEFKDFDLPEELPRFDKESFALLDKAFARLGDGCAKLLHAFYFHEQSLQDIAESIGKNPAAIRKQKQRCVEKLRGFFAQLS